MVYVNTVHEYFDCNQLNRNCLGPQVLYEVESVEATSYCIPSTSLNTINWNLREGGEISWVLFEPGDSAL